MTVPSSNLERFTNKVLCEDREDVTASGPLRLVNHQLLPTRIRGNGWKLVFGDRTAPEIAVVFYELMKRFIYRRPGSAPRTGSSDRGIVIKTLTADLLSNGVPVVNPAIFAGVCPLFMDSLVNDLHDRFSKAIIYRRDREVVMLERIGRLRGSLDGELMQEWDLGGCLAEFPLGTRNLNWAMGHTGL
ncbi:hypothetical protein VTN77DRAFT_3500 [Rasamsonia byssochlamydoides]|uniref:uncharacterized protein n=1 Tax=Rasamsonia byssochlamydoides TaxID=89139 RepID=UPI003743FF49